MNIDWSALREIAQTRPLQPYAVLPNSADARCIFRHILAEAGVPHETIGKFSQAGGIVPFGYAGNERSWKLVRDAVQLRFGPDFSRTLVENLIAVNDDYASSDSWATLVSRRLIAYCNMCEASSKIFPYMDVRKTLPHPTDESSTH